MFAISPFFLAWIRSVNGPFWVSLISMVSVGGVVITGLWVLRSPIVPSPMGIARVWCGLTPELVGILAPVALLFASVAAARLWKEGGEIRALHCIGKSVTRLIPAGLFCGVVVGVGVAFCAHILAPAGRMEARSTLLKSVTEAPLRARTATQMGDVWLRVGSTHDGVAHDLVVATDGWLAWSKSGKIVDGGLLLEQGEARPLHGDWVLQFVSAHMPISVPNPVAHNFERTTPMLMERVREKQAKGEPSSRARLTLHKRTSLALSAPLFALLGIPLGLTFRRPAWITAGVVTVVWMVQRLGDHLVYLAGPELIALAPLCLLTVAAGILWRTLQRTT